MLKNHRIAIAASLLVAGAVSANTRASEYTGSSSTTSALKESGPIQQIASLLSGTWKTVQPYEVKELEDGSSAEVFMMMSLAPVMIEGMENVMYAESVLSDAPQAPFRQSIFQLYDYKGKVRLRTYTMAVSEDTLGVISGMVAVPELFSGVTSSDLIATLDVELNQSSTGFSGSTPYPYPTSTAGAVEMTSSVTFDGKTLTTTDRGYDAQGKIVWGDGIDSTYSFEKSEPYATVIEHDNGLVVVEFPSTISDIMVTDGDKMHMHYSGYLADGMKFDASYDRGAPYGFIYPPGRNAIEGWGQGMDGLTLGAHRKLIIPSDLGYGPSGNPRARIPGGSTLVFNVFLANLESAEPATITPDEDGAGDGSSSQSHEGHDHSNDN